MSVFNIYTADNEYFNSIFEKEFGCRYTMTAKLLTKLYYDIIPDGIRYYFDNYVIIIVTMPYTNNGCYENGKQRLFNIYDKLISSKDADYWLSCTSKYLILSCGKTNEDHKYYIYDENKNDMNITLHDLNELLHPNMNEED